MTWPPLRLLLVAFGGPKIVSALRHSLGPFQVGQNSIFRRRFGVMNSRVGASEGSVAAVPLRFSTFEVKFHYVFHYFWVGRTLDFTKNVTPNEQNHALGSILLIIPIEFWHFCFCNINPYFCHERLLCIDLLLAPDGPRSIFIHFSNGLLMIL